MHELTRRRRTAFSLVELLVVVAIVGVLVALILPAVQAAREVARRMSCSNNLRQVGLGLQNFESTTKVFPSSLRPTPPDPGGLFNGWSVHAQILPYLEQANLYQSIDFNLPYSAQSSISSVRVRTYICPAEIRSAPKFNTQGDVVHVPPNYAANQGPWFVFNPVTREGSRGAFRHSQPLRPAEFVDGLSQTLGFAECKARTSYFRNSTTNDPSQPVPASIADLCALGGDVKQDGAHGEWVDGKVHETGFTSTFAPNAKVQCAATGSVDVDWVSQAEGRSATAPTFAAVTARSYHPPGVLSLMMDGSVHLASNSIERGVWQALSTRDGGETTNWP